MYPLPVARGWGSSMVLAAGVVSHRGFWLCSRSDTRIKQHKVGLDMGSAVQNAGQTGATALPAAAPALRVTLGSTAIRVQRSGLYQPQGRPHLARCGPIVFPVWV